METEELKSIPRGRFVQPASALRQDTWILVSSASGVERHRRTRRQQHNLLNRLFARPPSAVPPQLL